MTDPFGRDQPRDRPRDQPRDPRNGGPDPKIARAVLSFMNAIGAKAVTPKQGDVINLVVLPVADAPDHRQVAARDWPDLAARIVVMPCSACGQDCWVDPNSHGAATPTLICIPCLPTARVAWEKAEKEGRS